jgi:hypothetical protein
MKNMIATTATFLAVTASGCGGLDSLESYGYFKAIPANQSDTVEYYVRDVPSGIDQKSPNNGLWSVSVRHMGPDIVSFNPTGDFSPVTSLSVPSQNQKGLNTGTIATTPAFQVNGPDYGSFIDTNLTPDRVVAGGGPHSVFEFTPVAPIPMSSNVAISFDAAIPFFERNGTGVGQLAVYFYLKERSTGTLIALLWAVYDNRFDTYAPFASSDTQVAFSSSPFETNSFGSITSRSEKMQSTTGGLKFYEIKIEQSNLQTIFGKINDFRTANSMTSISTVVTDYDLALFGKISEVFKLSPSDDVRLGTRVSNLSLWFKY